MIWDIMYELPLFGEWRVVRSAGALLVGAGPRILVREHPRVLDVFSFPQPFGEKNMGKCYVSMYSIPTGERCPDVSRT
mgnify:FL=1